MIVKEITEKESLTISNDFEICERLTVDNPIDREPMKLARVIGGFINDEIFGIVTYYNKGDFETCHIKVLRDFRARYGVMFAKEALKHRGDKPLLTCIPNIFDDVKKFAEFLGFKLINVHQTNITKKNKQLYLNVLRLDT